MEERKKIVDAYVEKNLFTNLVISSASLSSEDIIHIKSLALSVVNTRDKVLSGGGFVQSVVDNDLYGAIARGDLTAIKALPLLVNVNKFLNQFE